MIGDLPDIAGGGGRLIDTVHGPRMRAMDAGNVAAMLDGCRHLDAR